MISVRNIAMTFLALGILWGTAAFADISNRETDPSLDEFQESILNEAGVSHYWHNMAEDGINCKGISYQSACRKVARLGPKITPLLLRSLIDERYIANRSASDPDVPSYETYASMGQERDYRYCVWLGVTRELANAITGDMREKFLEHLIFVAQTPRTWLYGDGPSDYIAYETISTLAAFRCPESDNALFSIVYDDRRHIDIRIYAANFLTKSSNPEYANRARLFIIDTFEHMENIPDLRFRYSNMLAYWNTDYKTMRARVLEEIKSVHSSTWGQFYLAFLFDVYEEDKSLIKPMLLEFLNGEESNGIIASYYPLVTIEFLLEHCPVEELGRVWVKERCLAHGGLKFLGYTYDFDKEIALRWQLLRKKLFPELDEVELQIMTEENDKELRKQWGPFVARDPWRIVYTMDKETGEVVLGAGKE